MVRCVRILLAPVLKCLIALCLLGAGSTASASEVQLRPQMTVAATADDWTWLTLEDPVPLRAMPAGWHLLVDQVRFRRIAVVATGTDGRTWRTERRADQLGAHRAPGGLLKFEPGLPGRDIRSLAIGFERIDDVSLMRKVTAASPRQAAALEARWLILMGVFTGLLVSAFAYNLFVYAGQRYAFQRIYL